MTAISRQPQPALIWILILGIFGACVSCQTQAQDTQIIVQDDFESYTSVASMNSFWSGGTAQLEVTAPGGGKAASHDGGEMNKHGGFSVAADSAHNIFLSADFYDYATNVEKRVTVNLRSPSGESLDIGMVNANLYCVRAMGFSAKTNWIPFAKGTPATPGWRRITALLSATNLHVSLSVGQEGPLAEKNIPIVPRQMVFNQLRFGGLSGRPSRGGPVLVDNIVLALVDSSVSPALVRARLPLVPAASTPAAPEVTRPAPPAPIPDAKTTAAPAQSFVLAPGPKDDGIASMVIWWIFGALALIVVLLTGLLFTIHRSYKANASSSLALTLPSGSAPALLSAPGQVSASATDPEWQQRALAAEAIAAKQAHILKEKVGPELVDFAKETLVQGLYTQRNALLETQQRAQQALSDLESRLGELQLPQSQRIQEYEKRISELEKQLGNRNDEMRELTRATLMLVRRRLEQEKLEKPPESRRFN